MAFYFALLNVSSKREERQRASHRHSTIHRRRRHSIASIEETQCNDYRLLPRPLVVNDDQPVSSDAPRECEQKRVADEQKKKQKTRKDGHKKKKNHTNPITTDEPGCSRKESGRERENEREETVRGRFVKRGGASPRASPSPLNSPSRQLADSGGSRRTSRGSNQSDREGNFSPIRPSRCSINSDPAGSPASQLNTILENKGATTSKKVTFDSSPDAFIIRNSFLDEPVRRVQSGSVLSVVTSSSLHPYHLHTMEQVRQAKSVSGVVWCEQCLEGERGNLGETPLRNTIQNIHNEHKEEEDTERRSNFFLLRRRSTSDRHRLAHSYFNSGFVLAREEERVHRNKREEREGEELSAMTLSMDRAGLEMDTTRTIDSHI